MPPAFYVHFTITDLCKINTLCLCYQVLELEGKDKGEWGFKALKQMIKINFKLVSLVVCESYVRFNLVKFC